MKNEFHPFIYAKRMDPPRALSERILTCVHSDLNPRAWRVFSKMALIHLMVGSFSLLFCPQFGLHLTGGMGLMGILMQYGERACMLGCGVVFVTGTALIASLLLRPEEIRVIRKAEVLQFAFLGLLSMGAFLCTGIHFVGSLALFWLIGVVFGGLGSLELGWLIRSRFMHGSLSKI